MREIGGEQEPRPPQPHQVLNDVGRWASPRPRPGPRRVRNNDPAVLQVRLPQVEHVSGLGAVHAGLQVAGIVAVPSVTPERANDRPIAAHGLGEGQVLPYPRHDLPHRLGRGSIEVPLDPLKLSGVTLGHFGYLTVPDPPQFGQVMVCISSGFHIGRMSGWGPTL